MIQYVLLDHSAPRAVLFCLNRCLGAIRAITLGRAAARARRRQGRRGAVLRRDLDDDPRAPRLWSTRVLHGINDAGLEIAGAYFTTRVIIPGPYTQQQQQ